MKRKSKKAGNKNAKSGKWCIYLIGVLFSITVLIIGCVLYGNFAIYNLLEQNAKSTDPEKQLEFIKDIYDLVEDGYSAVILQHEYVSDLAKLLNSQNSTIQEEATRTLLYLTQKDKKFSIQIADQGPPASLFELIHSSNNKVAKMALMNLYLFVQQQPILGSKFLVMGLDKHLVQLVHSKPSKEILKIVVPIFLNLCQKNQYPAILGQSAPLLLSAFSKLLHHPDDEIVELSILALYSLAENSGMKLIFDNEMIETLVILLDHKHSETSNAVLMVLLYIGNNANFHNQLILDKKIFESIPKMLNDDRETAVKVGLNFVLKSVQASPNQTFAVFEANLVPLIADKLTDKSSFIQSQAASILCITVLRGNQEHVSTLLNMQIIPELYNILLETEDDDIKRLILNAFKILIQHADQEMKMNIYNDFERLDAFQEFSKLVTYRKRLIRNFAQSILDLFSSENLGISVCLKKRFFV